MRAFFIGCLFQPDRCAISSTEVMDVVRGGIGNDAPTLFGLE